MKSVLHFVSFVMLFASGLLLPRLAHAEAKVLATIDGENITEELVDQKAGPRMMRVLSQAYEVKREVIDEIIEQKLLEREAKKRGLTIEALLNQEVKNKAKEPSDVELRTMYEMNKNSRFKDKAFEEVSASLKEQLKFQKERMAYDTLMSTLKNGSKVSVLLERPSVEVSVDDDPAQGNPNAPIKLIEFSEFQCPFCKRARPTIEKVMSTYKDKVYYVFRDFPLSFHKEAKNAALSANCAHDQGKYWDFSKELWNAQQALSTEKYTEIAKKINLDMNKFNQCVQSRKYDKEIDKDQNDGIEVGVSGTPAYFINGKFLSGAQPFESFRELIEEELAKQK
jgi:protein-disulfide isomerase